MNNFLIKKMGVAFFIFFTAFNFAYASSGNLFSITGSGFPSTIDIQLCLSVSGSKPWSCENHTVTGQILNIRTIVPNHIYPAAGLKVFTPGYSVAGCTYLSNGYCKFSVSNSNPIAITLSSVIAPNLMSISPNTGTAAGNVGVTLSGNHLSGTSSVTFGGIAATSVNVVSDTTVTAVTPAHPVGPVDVVITTLQGQSSLTNGYNYQAIAIGQVSGGGLIACLEDNNNLIAAVTDNAEDIVWGGIGTEVGVSSNTDGALNTIAIVMTIGNNGGIPYAAKVCSDYEIDSQGNTPCVQGNACYNDWFLPAGNNTTTSGQLNCLYVNGDAINISDGDYWSSTEATLDPVNFAFIQNLKFGDQDEDDKNGFYRVRCVRRFTP